MKSKKNEIHEFHADLVVQSLVKNKESDAVTAILGIEPEPPLRRPSPIDAWAVESPLKPQKDLECHVKRVLDEIEPLAARIRKLKAKFPATDVYFRCAHFTNMDNGFCEGPILSAAVLGRIGNLGLHLYLDTYAGTDSGGRIKPRKISHDMIVLSDNNISPMNIMDQERKALALFLVRRNKFTANLHYKYSAKLPRKLIGLKISSRVRGAISSKSTSYKLWDSQLNSILDQIKPLNGELKQLALKSTWLKHLSMCCFWVALVSNSESGFCGAIRIGPSVLQKLGRLGYPVIFENYNTFHPVTQKENVGR